MGGVLIESAGAERVDALRDLYLAMHAHHRTLTRLPVVDDETAWSARRRRYLNWLADGSGRLFVASAGEGPVGYAMLVLHEGDEDTFPLVPRYGEVYSLSVAPDERGSGIGGLLLDAVDELLVTEGDLPLTIAVMTENEDALRFYQRRGLVPGEIVLFRFPDR